MPQSTVAGIFLAYHELDATLRAILSNNQEFLELLVLEPVSGTLRQALGEEHGGMVSEVLDLYHQQSLLMVTRLRMIPTILDALNRSISLQDVINVRQDEFQDSQSLVERARIPGLSRPVMANADDLADLGIEFPEDELPQHLESLLRPLRDV